MKTVPAILVLSLCLILPLSAMQTPTPGGPGSLSGRILDSQGAPIPNTVVIAVDSATSTRKMTASNALGVFQMMGLPEGSYEIQTAATGFLPFQAHAVAIAANQDLNLNIVTLTVGAAPEFPVGIQAAPAGGSAPPSRIRMGSILQSLKLLKKVQAVYPASVRQAGIQADVILQVKLGTDGAPKTMEVISKDLNPDLVKAAVDAVQQWRYQPTELNGELVEVVTTIVVNFRLASSTAPSEEVAAEPSSTPQRIEVESPIGRRPSWLVGPISKVNPPYPAEARQERIQGTVHLDIVIGTDGSVVDLKATSGHPLLVQAAMDAVKQWRYQTTVLNGQPVEVGIIVTVNFSLGQ